MVMERLELAAACGLDEMLLLVISCAKVVAGGGCVVRSMNGGVLVVLKASVIRGRFGSAECTESLDTEMDSTDDDD